MSHVLYVPLSDVGSDNSDLLDMDRARQPRSAMAANRTLRPLTPLSRVSPHLHATVWFCQLSALFHGCSESQLQAHPSPLPHLPSATCRSYGTRSLSRISASTCQSRQASQSEATGPTDAPSERNISSWVGTCGLAQRNAAAAAFFCRRLLCRAALILIRSLV